MQSDLGFRLGRTRPFAARVSHVSISVALGSLVTASVVIRFVLALGRETPRYLPDEYLYGQLARSIAAGRGAEILGVPASFPALLQPILTSVAWLPGDAALAYRLTQLIGVVALSLAAVPTFLIAQRLGIRSSSALLVSAIALAAPGQLYGSYITSDAVGTLCALFAVLALMGALTRPTAAAQTAFLAAVGLATLARLQYVVLLPVALAACVIVTRGNVRAAVSRYRVLVGLTGLIAVTGAAIGVNTLGRYEVVSSFSVSGHAVHWAISTSFLLAVVAGIAIAPGGVAWALSQLKGPTSLERSAFAAIFVGLTASLVAASAAISVETGSERFFERYLLPVVPLAAVAFACWLEDGRPARVLAAAAAVAIAIWSMVTPISEFSAGQGRADSPTLLSVGRLEEVLGVGSTSLAVALAIAIAAALGAAVARNPRLGAPTLVVTVMLLAVASAGAHSADHELSRGFASRALGAEPSWIDAAGLDGVLLVQTMGGEGAGAMALVEWNSSITRAAALGSKTEPIDGSRVVTVTHDGALHVDGSLVAGPIALERTGTRTVFANASRVAEGPGFVLVRPESPARLAAIAEGLREDSWLAQTASLTVYGPRTPRTCRSASLRLSLPVGAAPMQLRAGSKRLVVTATRPASIVLTAARRSVRRISLSAVHPTSRPGSSVPVSARARMSVRTFGC